MPWHLLVIKYSILANNLVVHSGRIWPCVGTLDLAENADKNALAYSLTVSVTRRKKFDGTKVNKERLGI